MTKSIRLLINALVAALVATAPASQAQNCPGDINLDNEVTVDEILTVVNAALNGCTGGPATPLPTVRPTPTATTGPGLRFVDNRDGTITDTRTGLMWEKKVGPNGAPGGLHDVDNKYLWAGSCYTQVGARVLGNCQADQGAAGTCSRLQQGQSEACVLCAEGACVDIYRSNNPTFPSVWTWLNELNAGSGFAGYTDWRLPTIEELSAFSTTEYAQAFYTFLGCQTGCSDITDPACSCTDTVAYWTSTVSVPHSVWIGVPGSFRDVGANVILSTAARAVRRAE